MYMNRDPIEALNNSVDLNFFNAYNRDYHDIEIDDDPYTGIQISSNFYDLNTISNANFIKKAPIYLSINIQTCKANMNNLYTKYLNLKGKM